MHLPENPTTAEKVRKGTWLKCLAWLTYRVYVCLPYRLMQVSVWKMGYFEINFWGKILDCLLNYQPHYQPNFLFCFVLFCFFFFLSFYSLFPWTNGHWSELVKLLARVVNRGEMSALYRMCLCVGYAQLHFVLSMKTGEPCDCGEGSETILRLTCWQNKLFGLCPAFSPPCLKE